MPIPATRLTTTVENMSGASKHFSYLGPHGTTLAASGADARFTAVGGVEALVVSGSPAKDARRLKALQADLQSGALRIVQSPSPVLYDQITDLTKMTSVANNAVTAITPDYTSSPIVTTTTTTAAP